MHYSLSWSGGKDSTASVILAHLKREPLDSIIFSEVMFDKKNGISGESLKHIDFIMNIAKPLFESWGYNVYILHSDKDYLDVFNATMEHPRKYVENKGKKYGFCISGLCSVKRDCKLKPIKDFYSHITDSVTSYVGIAADEPTRLISMHKQSDNISLLEKYGYTESMAKELCREYGLLSPIYQFTKRGGCWMCPNAKLCEHKEIRGTLPSVWRQFMELEHNPNIAHRWWNCYTKETLQERDEKLSWMDRQLQLF